MCKEEFAKVKTNEKGEKVVDLPKKGNPKGKVELRDGETDYRDLSKREMNQLNVRAMTNLLVIGTNLVNTMAEIEVLLIGLLKKSGVTTEEIDKMFEFKTNEKN